MVAIKNTHSMNVQSENISSQNSQEDDASKYTSVLLCVENRVNGIQVRFLIDSGASECFISEILVEDNDMPWCKSWEKLKIHLADGSLRPCNHCLR